MTPPNPTRKSKPNLRTVMSTFGITRPRVGGALLAVGLALCVLGLVTVVTIGSGLMFLSLFFIGPALTVHYSKRRALLALPGLVCGIGSLAWIIVLNTWGGGTQECRKNSARSQSTQPAQALWLGRARCISTTVQESHPVHGARLYVVALHFWGIHHVRAS